MSSAKLRRGARGSRSEAAKSLCLDAANQLAAIPPLSARSPCAVVSTDRSADRIQQSAQERRGLRSAPGAVVPVRDWSGRRRRRVNSHRAARARPFNNENHVDDGGGCGRGGRRVRRGAAAVTKPPARPPGNQPDVVHHGCRTIEGKRRIIQRARRQQKSMAGKGLARNTWD